MPERSRCACCGHPLPRPVREDLAARALDLVAADSDAYTKNALAERLGGRRSDALAAIERLLRAGWISPARRRARLRLTGKARLATMAAGTFRNTQDGRTASSATQETGDPA